MVVRLTVTGLVTVVVLLVLAPAPAAQPRPAGQAPRIGVLAPGHPPHPAGVGVEALRQGLRELGYVEGQTITLELRWDERKA